MPYSFVEIEKQKKWVIRAIFIFLIILYFLIAEALWLITKLFFFFRFEFIAKSSYLFSFKESIFVFFIASVVALIHWYFSTRNMISRILSLLGAIEPDTKDSYHWVLKNVIDEVCIATGGSRIHAYVVPLAALNAFAISDPEGDAVIGVTEGVLARLNRSQLEAVIAHEAAHIGCGDSLSTTVACSLFAVYSALLEKISRVLGDTREARVRRADRVIIYLIVVYIVLSITQFINLLFNLFLSRQKEYRADAIAVRLNRNPISLAEALYIISRGWRGVGGVSDSLSPIFIMSPDYNNLEEREGFISDLFSTHPPTSSRLAVLLDMAHCDIAALKQGIKPKERMPLHQGIVELKEEPNKQWYIYKDGNWKGSVGLEELFNLGLSPHSWVSKLGEDFIKPALEDEDLCKALRDRLASKVTSGGENCPECKQPLSEILYEGAPVLKCYYCSGIFASNNVISRIITREDVAFDTSIRQSAEAVLQSYSKGIRQGHFKVVYTLNCPRCDAKMRRGFFSYAYPMIEVDRCENCRYIWFNKNELEILQYLSEKFRQDMFKT